MVWSLTVRMYNKFVLIYIKSVLISTWAAKTGFFFKVWFDFKVVLWLPCTCMHLMTALVIGNVYKLKAINNTKRAIFPVWTSSSILLKMHHRACSISKFFRGENPPGPSCGAARLWRAAGVIGPQILTLGAKWPTITKSWREHCLCHRDLGVELLF